MHYYIDGYNLLFRILKAGDDLRKQREEITLDLDKKASFLELDLTLVFDSHYQEDANTRSHFNSIEIIFTARGETADEFILQELKESHAPSQHIVVTSDKKLARLCQLRLGKTESIDEFLAWTTKRYKNKLRQKRQQTLHPPILKTTKVETIKVNTPPSDSEPPQNCFDYYLDRFEKEIAALEKEIPFPPSKKPDVKTPKVKKLKAIKKETQTEISDLERWQKAFERQDID
jgi:uncharacterized protein